MSSQFEVGFLFEKLIHFYFRNENYLQETLKIKTAVFKLIKLSLTFVKKLFVVKKLE